MEAWAEIGAWRRNKRAELLSRRLAAPRRERQADRSAVSALMFERVSELKDARIGFYWPIKGEIDLRHVVRRCLAERSVAALPVVVENRKPLEFWAWRPRIKLVRGIWNIPVPAERRVVRPTILLIPLLGFDRAGYRLGYGGGYYDRTLAAFAPRPLTIGVGSELGRLETIHPQSHDIPMDAIVTEAGFAWFGYCHEPVDAMAGRRPQTIEPSNREYGT